MLYLDLIIIVFYFSAGGIAQGKACYCNNSVQPVKKPQSFFMMHLPQLKDSEAQNKIQKAWKRWVPLNSVKNNIVN